MSIIELVAASGERLRVVWATDASGTSEARDYWLSLPENQRNKAIALFKRLADLGVIYDEGKFKFLGQRGKRLYEFKLRDCQERFLGDFRPGSRFVIALGVMKRGNKISPAAIERAQRILVDYDRREASKT